MKDIAIYGAGGFGQEIACLINLINEHSEKLIWNFIGFFDDDSILKGTSNKYGIILGGRDELNSWETPLNIVVAIGNPQIVKNVADSITNPMIEFPNIIAPNVTYLDKDSIRLGKGNIICTNCMISCNVTIGDFNLFNGYIPIGHDTEIGNFNVIMPSVNLSGGVKVGNCNFMGVQSVILQYLKVGNNTRIGSGAVVMKNTKDGFLYIGNPAKKVEL